MKTRGAGWIVALGLALWLFKREGDSGSLLPPPDELRESGVFVTAAITLQTLLTTSDADFVTQAPAHMFTFMSPGSAVFQYIALHGLTTPWEGLGVRLTTTPMLSKLEVTDELLAALRQLGVVNADLANMMQLAQAEYDVAVRAHSLGVL